MRAGNKIGDVGAEKLADMLQVNKSLLTLKLSGESMRRAASWAHGGGREGGRKGRAEVQRSDDWQAGSGVRVEGVARWAREGHAGSIVLGRGCVG